MRESLLLSARARLRVSWWGCVAALIALIAVSPSSFGQEAQTIAAAPRPLITQALDEAQLTRLSGNTHPLARPQFDLGTAPASLPMQRMLLVLKRGLEQEAALERFMDDQQDKNSPSYHKWLTPEQFGQQFGPTDADLQTITAWLQSHGFQVGSTKGRTVLEFSGSASQVQEAFHTSIHKYIVNGEQHWANASDPSIPTALMPAVAGIASLNDFPRKPMNAPAGVFKRDKQTGKIEAVNPEFTFPSGCVENNSVQAACFYGVGPWDFATIYDVQPLWNAGVNGTGQTIAIVGESNINPQDVADFQSIFGLPANPPNIILNGPDPGLQPDEGEADIDVQWSGAVAPKATIDFVVSQSTETTAGIDLSAVYIVENNLAPVMSESYGLCELGLGTAGNQFYNALWQQAAAQGITVFISSGDNGSAGCDDFGAQSPAPAKYGLQVSGFASTPYNVAVGGTDFNDFSNPATYWSTTNNSTTQASALSYIPEVPWNSSCTNAIFSTIGLSTNPETNCNDSRVIPNFVVPVGGSGGASACTTPSGSTPSTCAGGYVKPSWQTGTGVPADGKRDIPDVSLFASNGFLQSFYIVCQSDQTYFTCNLNLNSTVYYFRGFGGTSVSSPAFAGLMALVNQQYGRQGNANYILYKLAAQQPTAFHDVTTGTIAMPCATGSPNCSTTTAGHAYGVLTGYNAGVGYDLATGLGSVDANLLVTKWNSITLAPSTTTLNSLTPTTITHGQAVNFNVTVASQSGTGATPTGQVSLIAQPTSSTQGIGGFALNGSGIASGSTEMLPGGTYSVTAHYPGDSTYAPSDSTGISVTVGKENSQPKAYLVTFNSNGTINNPNASTTVYGSSYLLRVDVDNAAGQLCSPVATTGATGCPSGTVTLTNNGNQLDAGTYALNSYGYVEDQTVQLPGGTDSIVAAYAGDASFNSSSATAPITITPASTTTGNLSIYGEAVGQSANLTAYVNTTTDAAAPSGTVTFFANGRALNGTTAYSPSSGGPGHTAYLYANLITDTNAFAAPGSYAITATYNGDANYSGSTSAPTNTNVIYPTPVVGATPSSQTVAYGGTATITALVDTTNKSVYPTGTVTFSSSSGGTPVGPAACMSATDANGNFACQAAAAFTVTSSSVIFVNYSGDPNYPAASGTASISMPDFTMFGLGTVQVTAGQSQNVTLTISSFNGFSGTVTNFACSGLPAESSCSFNPTSATLPINASVPITVTVTTAAIGHVQKNPGNRARATSWGLSQTLILFGACFIAIPLSRRRGRVSIAVMLLSLLVAVPSCGGGGGSGGGGGTPNPVPSISSLSPSQVAAGSQIQFLNVNGANFISSARASYNGIPISSAVMSPTQLVIQLSPNNVANTGQYPVVVTNPLPGGGASAPVNFSVLTGTPTGNFNATVTATSGPITHTTSLYMTVQ